MSEEFADQFLEQLQAETYARLGITPDFESLSAPPGMAVTVWEQSLGRPLTPAEVREAEAFPTADYAMRPTKFEHPFAYAMMRTLTRHIEKVLADHDIGLPSRPRFGTLATGQVNAMTVAVPGGGHLVLLENELLTFANLICKAIVLACPATEAEDGWFGFSTEAPAHLDEDDTAVVRFTETLLAYLVDGRPAAAPQYLLGSWRQQIVTSLLRDAVELFVVGHEYGHIIGGHLGSARLRSAGVVPVEQVDYAWQQEYEADYIGVHLGVLAMREKIEVDADYAFCGFEIFFSALDIMDRAASLLQFGDESARRLGSHPPSFDRRATLRDSAVRLVGGDESGHPLGLGRAYAAVLDTLWERARPAVVRARRHGVRLAPMWTFALTTPAAQEAT
ncbi:hypothetical protein AB0M54_15100 [Actinoplanes sp. NPDC051470]|uniref:hypothetical protein n=1 Tax=Actinoplanes sp. NPDC051470 TaxID=3157224 RepID=UPI00341B4779